MDTNQYPMTEQERATYSKLIEWLAKSWYGVPDSDVLLPYIAARYTFEEALFLPECPMCRKRWLNFLISQEEALMRYDRSSTLWPKKDLSTSR